MQKITFQNGSVITSGFLNDIQVPPRFDSEISRSNFFSKSEVNSQWEIQQRDSLKDWELPNPSIEPYTSVGKLAHHGRILGWTQTEVSTPLTISYGPPRLTILGLDGETPLVGYSAIVETGSVIDTDYSVKTWARTLVLLGANSVKYIYYDLDSEELVAATTLPSRQNRFSALAKVTVGSSGQINEYIDLRQSTYIDSLGYYGQRLINSAYITTNSTLISWQRAIVDTSNGGVILTLPSADLSADGDLLGIVDISRTFNTNSVILRPSATTTLNNSSNDVVVSTQGANIEMFYHALTQNWIMST